MHCRVFLVIGLILAMATTACALRQATPSPTPVPSPTLEPTEVVAPATPSPGSISGAIRSPNEIFPPLRVFAREVRTGQVRWAETQDGERSYTLRNLPPGSYVLVAWYYPTGVSGAYTSLDTLFAQDEDAMSACARAIVEIELGPGEHYTGADIGCWGADFFDLVSSLRPCQRACACRTTT